MVSQKHLDRDPEVVLEGLDTVCFSTVPSSVSGWVLMGTGRCQSPEIERQQGLDGGDSCLFLSLCLLSVPSKLYPGTMERY